MAGQFCVPRQTTDYVVGEEVFTGRYWINGNVKKKIYQKMIDFGAGPNATTKGVEHGISNLGQILNIRAIWQNYTTGYAYINSIDTDVPGFQPDSNILTALYTHTKIICTARTDRSSFYIYVLMEYTKTTD